MIHALQAPIACFEALMNVNSIFRIRYHKYHNIIKNLKPSKAQLGIIIQNWPKNEFIVSTQTSNLPHFTEDPENCLENDIKTSQSK